MKVIEEADTAVMPPLDALAGRLGAALPLAGPEALAEALARVEPDAAAAWLQENAGALAAAEPGVLDRVLGRVAVVLGASGNAGAVRALVPLMAERAASLPEREVSAALGLVSATEAAGLRAPLEALLEAFPFSAAVLRAAASAREADADVEGTHALLTRLVFADPSASNIRNVQRWRERLSKPAGRRVRFALLGSYTLDLLGGYLDAECRALGLVPESYVAPFNSWEREAIDPSSGLRAFDAEVAFLAVSIDDLVPSLAGGAEQGVVIEAVREAVDRVVSCAAQIATWYGGVLVVHGFHSAYGDPLGIAAGTSRSLWLAELNGELAERLRSIPRTHFLDVQDILVRRSGGPLDDAKMRHYAKLRLSPQSMAHVARTYAGYIAAVKGLTRKCVIVDLDNTLWGGVIGEDGVEGIRLAGTSPGVEYLDLQRFLHSLTSRGILLAIASKNNAGDALAAIREHPAMLLREDSFAAMQIHWRPKPDSVRQIASELNVGLDSLVFVDDNPNERALMRQALPDVLTPDLPRDPALFRSTLESLPQLQTLVVTEEDRARAGLYRAQRQRDQVRVQATSLDDYLRSLDVSVTVAVDDRSAVDRVHQLLQRTNQFNLTTRRHAAAEIARWMEDAAWRVYTLRARDRYGDHGLSAVAVVHGPDREWRIDTFLMSCRVISYGIESALLSVVAEDARRADAATLCGEFISTAKNAPAADFYTRHGFTDAGEDGELRIFRLDFAAGVPECPEWIAVERPS